MTTTNKKFQEPLKKRNVLFSYYVGFIFQNYNLIEELSVNDNIMLLKNKKSQEILKKMGSNNPMIATLLNKVENKPSTPKQMSKIDVSGLVKVKQE